MSDGVLTKEELESLLSAAAPDDARQRVPDAAGRSRDHVAAYDFRRPDRVGEPQLGVLRSMHEGLDKDLGAPLSTLLRTPVEARLFGVDRLGYGELVYGVESPTCLTVLQAKPLGGHALLEIQLAILRPMIDRMLGAGKQSGTSAPRPLTEIEIRLASRITGIFLAELNRVWDRILPLDLAVERVESDPRSVHILPPHDFVVLIGFELAMGDDRGTANFCIPQRPLDAIRERLTARDSAHRGSRDIPPRPTADVGRQLYGSLADLEVMLAETKISMSDLMDLQVGDIIATETDHHQPLHVSVQGITKFTARPGSFQGRKAIQVDTPLGPAERPLPAEAKRS